MKQYIFTGLATGLLLTTAGLVSSSLAGQEKDITATPNSQAETKLSPSAAPKTQSQSSNIVKVGESQSQEEQAGPQSITKIQSHDQSGHSAVTLYVRNIPVVTFVGEKVAKNQGVKVANKNSNPGSLVAATPNADKVADDPKDPVWRATTVAAKLNQLNQAALDPNGIKVIWDKQRKGYVIRNGNQHLMEMSKQTLAPQQTKDAAKDALQIANRLRQQMGGTPSQTTIPGQPLPKPIQKIARRISGMASWYGPGFQGNPTASGERFNQYALTAAHRSLAFGTQVRVTNINNGRSVVVRINDRGPFTGGRILDLSRGAAQAIGVVSSGVAPVRLEVLQ